MEVKKVVANFDQERGLALLVNMERIRAFEEQALLAAERDKLGAERVHDLVQPRPPRLVEQRRDRALLGAVVEERLHLLVARHDARLRVAVLLEHELERLPVDEHLHAFDAAIPAGPQARRAALVAPRLQLAAALLQHQPRRRRHAKGGGNGCTERSIRATAIAHK